MNLVIGLIRIAVLGMVLFGLVSIGLVFFAIVSVMLMVMAGVFWLKQKEVLGDPRAMPTVTTLATSEDVVVERKVIEADYEEI